MATKVAVIRPPVRPVMRSKFDFIDYRAVWTSKQKSLTFPGRTLTLRQIADRFAAGLQNVDEKVALYDDGHVVIKNFEKLDLTERMEIVKLAERHMQEILRQRQLAQKAKHDESFAKIVQEKVDLAIAERRKAEAVINGKNE